jgi:hypothetical protein
MVGLTSKQIRDLKESLRELLDSESDYMAMPKVVADATETVLGFLDGYDIEFMEGLEAEELAARTIPEEGEQEFLIDYFSRAAGFRESHILVDKPWNPKNAKYARYLRAVLQHIESLPSDHPTFRKLAGVQLSDGDWAGVIHCEADDPAAWFEEWANALAEEDQTATQ